MDRLLASGLLSIGLAGLLALTVSPAMAARKYYPKGFTPPADARLIPAKPQQPGEPAVEEETPDSPGVRTYILPAKPKDEMTRLLEEQHLSEALRLADQRLQQHPSNMSLRLLHAYIQREKENFLTAETEYNWVVGHTRSREFAAKAYSGLGWTQLAHARQAKRLGDSTGVEILLRAADTSFQKSLQRDKKLHTAWTGLAQLHLIRQKPDEAEHALTRAAALAPSDTQMLLTRGQYHIASGSPTQALTFLFKAKQQEPYNPEVYLLLAQAYFGLNRVDDGMIQLQHLLEQDPDHNEALKLLSEAYANKMKPADAEAALQKAVFLNPSDVDTAMTLLHVYDASTDPGRSIPLLENLISLEPQQPRYTKALLQRLARQNQWEAVYQKGLSLIGSQWNIDDANTLTDPGMETFVKSIYIHGKKQLRRDIMFSQPELARLKEITLNQTLAHPENLSLRLAALLLDPTVTLPVLPSPHEKDADSWPILIQIAYLQGDRAMHDKLLQWVSDNPALSKEARLTLSDSLYALGDYTGAETLVAAMLKTDPNQPEALHLQKQLRVAKEEVNNQLRGLQLLSSRLPKAYWDNNAEDALQWGTGNWQLHATLADSLWERHDYSLALAQQKLAAQYAPNDKERSRWLKKAQKTREKLDHLHTPPQESTSAYRAQH